MNKLYLVLPDTSLEFWEQLQQNIALSADARRSASNHADNFQEFQFSGGGKTLPARS